LEALFCFTGLAGADEYIFFSHVFVTKAALKIKRYVAVIIVTTIAFVVRVRARLGAAWLALESLHLLVFEACHDVLYEIV
jgi:hypothetical protein